MDIGAQFKITAGVIGQAQIDKLNDSLQRTEKQQQRIGVSAAQTAAAMRTLPAQFTDIATQLAGGQSPFLILLQQGGQIKDSFGGIRPAAEALLSVLTPVRLIMGGVAAAIGTVVLAAVQGSNEIANLNRSLILSGNYAGQTEASYQRLKTQIAETANISVGSARELLAASIASAAFGSNLIQPAVTAMARVQKLSGQAAADVVKDFATMRSGVAAWAAEHNKHYNYLTAAQYKYIKQLEEQGNVEAAMKVNIEALNKAFQDRTEQLGYLEKAWIGLKNAASSAWDAMLGIGRPETIDDKIDALQKRIQSMRDMRAINDKVFGLIPNREPTPKSKPEMDAEAQLARLQEDKLRMEAAARDRAARDAEEQRAIEKEKQRPAIEAANAALRLQQAKNASQQRINLYDQEEAEIGRLRDAGFLSEQEYADRIGRVKQDKLRVSISLAQQELSIEQGKTAESEADVTQKAARLAAIQGRIADLQSQIKVAGIEAKANVEKANAEADKSFNDFHKKMRQQIVQLTNENDEAAAKLIADPIKRQRAELDAEIAKIKEKYAEIIIPIKLKLETAGADEAGRLREEIAQIEAQRDRAVQIKRDSNPVIDDWQSGLKAGLKDLQENVKTTGQMVREGLVGAFDKASDALADFVTTGKLNFKSLAASILADLAKMIAKQLAFNALKAGLSAMGGGFALGGAFDGGRQAFAQGGVVDGPTQFRFASGGTIKNGLMGEAGPEAIVPLKRGRDGKLGVAMSGGQQSGGITIGAIHVNNNGDASTEDVSGKNSVQMARAITSAVQAEIVKQKRPGGLLYAA